MERNEELRIAWDYVEHTGTSVFLTGKAGTGKTTFLRMLKERSAKTMIVVAPSGVAAINAGGVTIHSFFQLPLSPYVPGAVSRERYGFSREKLRIVRSLDLLVIDEISMVRSDTLDAVDDVLRRYRRDSRPFGGVQLLMIGDLRQLSPIVTASDMALLRDNYSTPYFFGSHALERTDYVTLQLTKVFRQQDDRFVTLLNHVRDCCLDSGDMQLLASRLNPSFRPPVNSGYIRLTTHNHQADAYNEKEMSRLPGHTSCYTASISGTFPETSFPTGHSLELKPGAQVMFIKNDLSDDHRYYNGKIGHVVSVAHGHVTVKCEGDASAIDVYPDEWENTVYRINEETNEIETDVQGRFRQLPLKPAWAITIHKSQGLTFDRAIIDAGSSFAPGQVYVALSRCRSIEGLVLATPVTPAVIMNDSAVSDYISHQERLARESIAKLPQLKGDYELELLRLLFLFRDIGNLLSRLTRVVSETFSKMFPVALDRLERAGDEFGERIIAVSDKWLAQLNCMTVDNITDSAFQERLKRSCRYFSDALSGVFGDWTESLPKIKSDNKQASRRVADITSDFLAALRCHVILLDSIATSGFRATDFLSQRQHALIESSSSAASASKKSRRKSKTPQPKPERPDTRQVTLGMIRHGMSPAEIAACRSLTLSTIYNHLVTLVGSGDMSPDDIIPRERINKIVQAIILAGKGATLTEIHDRLPAVDFGEIKIVITDINRRNLDAKSE